MFVRNVLFGLVSATLVQAESLSSFELNGKLRLTGWAETDTAYTPTNYGNADLRLDALKKLDQGMEMRLGLRASTLDAHQQPSSYGLGLSSLKQEQSPRIVLENYALAWEMLPGGFLSMGQYLTGAGEVDSDPLYQDLRFASTMSRAKTIRGLGFEGGGFVVAVGVPGERERGLSAYAQLDFPVYAEAQRSLKLKPVVEINLNNSERNPYLLAVEADYALSPSPDLRYAVTGSASLYGTPDGQKQSYGLFAQPALEWKHFATLAASGYRAFLGSDSLGMNYVPMPVQQFYRVEASFSFLSRLSLDLPFAWHDPKATVDGDEFFVLTPGVTLFPSSQSEFKFWMGKRWADQAWGPFAQADQNAAAGLMVGLQAKLDF
jgi:hypothetical protein